VVAGVGDLVSGELLAHLWCMSTGNLTVWCCSMRGMVVYVRSALTLLC
jgi:hypothetical protein